MIKEGCDIIGLCEIDNKNQTDIKSLFSVLEKGFEINVFSEKASSRSEFDVCLPVGKDRFFIKNIEGPTYSKLNNAIKRGVKYVLVDFCQNSLFYVFLSHWPSGMCEGNNELRELAAAKLQMEMEGIISKEKESRIIVMGDFNDEPYNDSLYKNCFLPVINILQRNIPCFYIIHFGRP
ncbi:MAG: endonuclease/exonuclease/phosphatase family protein [Oxalobacter formigenes]|nr:endonuclease/exonuclease/phosphatase family protein [Oxalobacter formigenes]